MICVSPENRPWRWATWEEALLLGSAPIYSSTINEVNPPVEVQDSDDEIIVGAGIGGESEYLDDTIPINIEKVRQLKCGEDNYALTELMSIFSDPALM